jgi:hypothetical protein
MTTQQLVYTHCPASDGMDGREDGFQTKACSAGLGPHRPVLEGLSTHLGAALRQHAPEAALAAKAAWSRADEDSQDALFAKVLAAYPVLWCYRVLPGDLGALTRTSYTGLDHEGRAGNFFAHTLVLPVDELAAHGHNPVALCGARAYELAGRKFKGGTLPDLESLEGAGTKPLPCGVLADPPWKHLLPELIAALIAAPSANRPVLLVLADWRTVAPAVGALLQLLPRGLRSRYSFITYEFDPRWRLPGSPGAGIGSRRAEHDLVVVCPPGPGDRGPDPSSFSDFAVFNQVSGERSKAQGVTRYAEFATRCLVEGRLSDLERHHDIAARLGCDRDAAACDALVEWIETAARAAPEAAVRFKCGILTPLVVNPGQANVVFDLIRADLASLAAGSDPGSLRQVVAAVAGVTDRLSPSASGSALPEPVMQIQRWAQAAIAAGASERASLWLASCGRWRDPVLGACLPAAMAAASSKSQPTPDDTCFLAQLLVDGLVLRMQGVGTAGVAAATDAPELLTALFTILPGVDPDTNEALWQRMRPENLETYFADKTDAQRVPLLRKLAGMAPPDRCPSAAAWFSERYVQRVVKLDEEGLFKRLESMALACRAHPAPEEVMRRALKLAAERIPEPPALALTIGRLAQASWGTAVADTAYRGYCDCRKARNVDPIKLDRELAEAGATAILCRDFVEGLTDWEEPASPRALGAWLDRPFLRQTLAAEQLADVAAEHFGLLKRRSVGLGLAGFLLDRCHDRLATSQALANLAAQVIRKLPIEPLPAAWRNRVAPTASLLPGDARGLLSVLEFLARIEPATQAPTWTLLGLPRSGTVWDRDIPALDPEDKRLLARWVLESVARVGLATPDEVGVLIALLDHLGDNTAPRIAEHLADLLRNRDRTTCVDLVTALIDANAQDSNQPIERSGAVVDELLQLLAQSGQDCRHELIEHLDHGFVRLDPSSRLRRDEMRRLARIARPLPPAPAPEKKGVAGKVLGGLFRKKPAEDS